MFRDFGLAALERHKINRILVVTTLMRKVSFYDFKLGCSGPRPPLCIDGLCAPASFHPLPQIFKVRLKRNKSEIGKSKETYK
jgi:hypothetical protein